MPNCQAASGQDGCQSGNRESRPSLSVGYYLRQVIIREIVAKNGSHNWIVKTPIAISMDMPPERILILLLIVLTVSCNVYICIDRLI